MNATWTIMLDVAAAVMAAMWTVLTVAAWRRRKADRERVARIVSETRTLAATYAEALRDLGVNAAAQPNIGGTDGENYMRALLAEDLDWLGLEPKYPTPADVRAEWRRAHALVEARQRAIQEAVHRANVEKAAAYRMQSDAVTAQADAKRQVEDMKSERRVERARMRSALHDALLCTTLKETAAAVEALVAEFTDASAESADGRGS